MLRAPTLVVVVVVVLVLAWANGGKRPPDDKYACILFLPPPTGAPRSLSDYPKAFVTLRKLSPDGGSSKSSLGAGGRHSST